MQRLIGLCILSLSFYSIRLHFAAVCTSGPFIILAPCITKGIDHHHVCPARLVDIKSMNAHKLQQIPVSVWGLVAVERMIKLSTSSVKIDKSYYRAVKCESPDIPWHDTRIVPRPWFVLTRRVAGVRNMTLSDTPRFLTRRVPLHDTSGVVKYHGPVNSTKLFISRRYIYI